MWVELAYSNACNISPGAVRQDASNERTFMSTRDMALFGAFTGGFATTGGYYTQGGDEPPCIAPVNEDFTTELQCRRQKYFRRARIRPRNPYR